ncbi:uncharacterized protein PAC_00284 [Phialocephala subalpina]|uniref:Uncharacterized protein n=1 Tax=Phialocephala subalpina TaxID=576137 RepID=A0A1L7WCB8_9HELO|nr:uncharacterized protein PAC_00284 [Phialocephala subalpina]
MSPHGLVPMSIVSRYIGSQDSRVDRGLCTAVSMLSAILTSGLGLTSNRDCFTAVFSCLVFYFGNKMIMYMFLIERAHIIRAPYERRMKDKVWVACMSFLIVGFGAISVTAFMWPNAEVSPLDGKCRIGQPLKVTIPLLTYDIVVNVSLTALFVHFLYPFLAPKGNRISLGQSLSSLRKATKAGCENGVTWTVTVVHWLTVNTQEVEDDIRSYHGNNPKLQPCAIDDNADLFKSTVKSAEVEVMECAGSATITQPPQACVTESIRHGIVKQAPDSK